MAGSHPSLVGTHGVFLGVGVLWVLRPVVPSKAVCSFKLTLIS